MRIGCHNKKFNFQIKNREKLLIESLINILVEMKYGSQLKISKL